LVFDYEKKILMQNYKNPYQNALFSMCTAIFKSEPLDQRSLLIESLNYILKLTEAKDFTFNLDNEGSNQDGENSSIKVDEAFFKSQIVENSVLYKAIDLLLNRKENSIESIYPLSYISMLRYISKTENPPRPLMIARTS